MGRCPLRAAHIKGVPESSPPRRSTLAPRFKRDLTKRR